ncbi:MAG: glycoside hydrolase family 28 [Edaphobacter sp.]|jgi:hypothetical protein|nr:glycoside hydrolase family 28 [Edaphobacter sp.]
MRNFYLTGLIFDHVEDVAINGLSVQGNTSAESVVRFIDSRDVLFTATRVLTPATTFLQLKGADNERITIDGGDLSKTTTSPSIFDRAWRDAICVAKTTTIGKCPYNIRRKSGERFCLQSSHL